MAKNDDVAYWFSLKGGVHIPVYKGESKEEALKRGVAQLKKKGKLGDAKDKGEEKKESEKSSTPAPTSKKDRTMELRAKIKERIIQKNGKITNSDFNELREQGYSGTEIQNQFDYFEYSPSQKKFREKYNVDGQKNASAESSSGRNPETKQKKDIVADKKTAEMDRAKKEQERLNKESAYQEALKNAKKDKVSVENGKMKFNGKDAPALETSEANRKWASELPDSDENHKSGVGDSLSRNLRPDGTLTPERQEMHRQIVEGFFRDHLPYAPEDERVAMFTGGGGASGKGNFSGTDRKTGERNIGKFYSQDKNPIVVDPDEIKSKLAELSGEADWYAKSKEGAGFYHEESSALAKQIYELALQHDYPVLYDGTATGRGVFKLIEQARAHGRKTEMNFIISDWQTVAMNSLDRYRKGALLADGTTRIHRLVPFNQLLGAHIKAFNAVDALQDQFDSFALWDNAGRNLRRVGTSSKGKKLKVELPESWDRFSRSAKEFDLSVAEKEAYLKKASEIEREINQELAKKKKK